MKWGDGCYYGEHATFKSYECGCPVQDPDATITTATYETCPNVNQCAGASFTDASNVFGTAVCQMCNNGTMAGLAGCGSIGAYDAGLMCLDLDDVSYSQLYQCRCPLGAEMVYYTADFFAELDEANDGQVNGDLIAIVGAAYTMPMDGWLAV